jgi:hypothetical protein
MKFNLARHYYDWGRDSECHQYPTCLCQRFKDGDEMFDPSKLPAKKQRLFPSPPVVPRDPSQSQQPVPTEPHERSMDHILEKQ